MRVVEREEVRSIANLVRPYGSFLVTSAATPHQSSPKPIACVNESPGCVFEYSDQHGEKGLSPGNCGRPSSQGQTKYLMKHNSTWDYHGMNENGYALFEIIYSPVPKRNSFSRKRPILHLQLRTSLIKVVPLQAWSDRQW